MKFKIQGSQKMHVRVAISQKAAVEFPKKLWWVNQYWNRVRLMLSDLMGTFPTPSVTQWYVCTSNHPVQHDLLTLLPVTSVCLSRGITPPFMIKSSQSSSCGINCLRRVGGDNTISDNVFFYFGQLWMTGGLFCDFFMKEDPHMTSTEDALKADGVWES